MFGLIALSRQFHSLFIGYKDSENFGKMNKKKTILFSFSRFFCLLVDDSCTRYELFFTKLWVVTCKALSFDA